MRHTKKSNPVLVSLIDDLKKVSRENDAPIWRDIATRLERPSSQWAEVNLSRIEMYVKSKETVVIPGKLLGSGNLTKAVNVVAYNFSAEAAQKVKGAGGKTVLLRDYIAQNPKGKGVRIIG